jgi:integrase
MEGDIIEVIEHKTKKHRQIKLNHDYMKHVRDCYDALGIKNPNEHCFLTQKQTVISIQWINRRFKEIKTKYRVPIKNFSSHSLRKCFSRRIFDMSGDDKTMSLLLLSECLGHSNTNITKRYIGLKTEQILNTYDLLSF